MKISRLLQLTQSGWACVILAASWLGTPSWANGAVAPVLFDRVESDTIFFKGENGKEGPKPIKTQLLDLSYLGGLTPSESGLPYFLFTGKPCQNCIDDKSIYVFRPSKERPSTFVYPGKILDPKTGNILLESRAFFGKCLPSKGDVIVIYQRERVDRRSHMQPSVMIAEPGSDFLREVLLERNFPKINATVRLTKNGKCKEIEGRKRFMTTRMLSTRKINEDDDDDKDKDKNDEKDKENVAP